MATSRIPLSALFCDPFISAAFRRAERDGGCALAVPDPDGPVLIGGDARSLIEAHIERMIALLDGVDGDPDLEDNDREPEESDQNGDEQDYSGDEGDRSVGILMGGSGL
ncbi:hypothetical protein [Sinorhizobium fredii]|uniref:hypothetical protein n=1 Tax=Rhizobium fredii TaxID=380 RepID=UPI0035155BDA